MASLIFDSQMFNGEVPFCRVYSMTGKEQLEKVFLQNRISYFIEWQERSFFSKLFISDRTKEKGMFTIHINEADVERATGLVQGMESIKLKRAKEDA